MEHTRIPVVIADDHPIVRAGIQAVIDATPAFHLVGVARSFAETITLLSTVRASVLVLDIHGMGGAPLTFVARLQRDYPQLAIIAFSSSIDLAPELLAAGILGYIAKEEVEGQLIDAIRSAHAGQRFLSPVVADYVERTAALRHQQNLTPQELHVLQLLAHGLGTSLIADQLGIDPRSAQNYITALRRKTGCHERTQLVDWYRRVYGGAPANGAERT